MPTNQKASKKFDVIGSGWVPCNKRRWRDARMVLCRPGYGIVELSFRDLDIGERRDDRDKDGNLINCKVRVIEYGSKIGDVGCNFANGESYHGIVFYQIGVFDFGFSKASWPSGDIREIAPEALKNAGWPSSPKGYFLLAKQGDFWERPAPKGAPNRKEDHD